MDNMPIKRLKIETGDPAAVTIFLVGCGGTGSFAALHLARLGWVLRERIKLTMVFIDPDRVELKNVGRQNFCPAEVGQFKAETLARRFGHAFGLEIIPITGPFEPELLQNYRPRFSYSQSGLSLIIGAIDNAWARKAIAEAIEDRLESAIQRNESIWWLDAGNSEQGGQIFLGNCLADEPILNELGAIICLPMPSVQEPELIEVKSLPDLEPQPSCAELAAAEVQGLMVNQAMADWLAVYAYRLLITHDLDMMATYIDQVAGQVHSRPITGGVVNEPPPAEDLAGPPDFAELLHEAEPRCLNCGGVAIYGQDRTREFTDDAEEPPIVDIVFCPACGWQMEQEEYEMLIETADEVAE